MKKYAFLVALSLLAPNLVLAAEDAASTTAPAAQPAAPAGTEAATTVAATAETTAAEPLVADADAVAENLEFISGEVNAVDAAAKSVTVKLYGETEGEAGDKILTITIDDATDITDGEKDRDLASLTAGTEVDVEYDPATNKATYIFVY